MRRVALVLASMALCGHARRLQTSSPRQRSRPKTGKGNWAVQGPTQATQALRRFLVTCSSKEVHCFKASARGPGIRFYRDCWRGTAPKVGRRLASAPLLHRLDFLEQDEEEDEDEDEDEEEHSEDSTLADLDVLIDQWREELALADDGSKPLDQDKMMRSWQRLIEKKEKELVESQRRELGRNSFVPAHLTSWQEATHANDPTQLVMDELEEEREEAEMAAEVDTVTEVVREDGDAADENFIAEWQLHAERARAEADKSTGSLIPTGPTSLLKTWRFRRQSKPADTEIEETIGIDLGTTNCAVAVVVNGKPRLIPMPDGDRILPSVVSYLPSSWQRWSPTSWPGLKKPARPPVLREESAVRVLVGKEARQQYPFNRHSTYSSTKRLMGRTASAKELKQLMALDVPHQVTQAREVMLACPALGIGLYPEFIAAELVRELRLLAEERLGRPVNSAVVTVPAYFDENQRSATESACGKGGLKRVRLLREPEAAALTFALDCKKATRVMVFDLGGGTFDVSVLDVGNGVIEVISSSGDPRLGGNDWDQALATWLTREFCEKHGVATVVLDGEANRRILYAAEKAKVELSSAMSTQIEVPDLHKDLGINVTLSRRKFEALCRSLLLQLVPPMREAVQMAGLELNETRMGTLVKGYITNTAPRMQKWRQQVAWRWRRLQQKRGATGLRQQRLGVPISKVLLVGGGTRMPSIGRFIKRMTGLSVSPTVNPDEAVALGAAVQAGILDGRIKQKLFNPYQHDRTMDKAGDE